VRRWQAHLDRNVGPATLAQCRSLALRIFQFAMDEGAVDANPVHKVPPPKRRVDPEEVFGEINRRTLTPQEAGRLLACFPLFWWDYLSTLLGAGLRFGELPGYAGAGSTSVESCPCSKSAPPVMRPAGSGVASSRGPRAAPASRPFVDASCNADGAGQTPPGSTVVDRE
jgi:hypothetical protein